MRPHESPEMTLRVAGSTDTQLLATSLVKNEEEGKRVVLQCIGVAPISQALKAVALANGQVAPNGFVFTATPTFATVRFPDRDTQELVERVAIRLFISRKSL